MQKERFGDSLTYSIDLEDPSILDYSIPKLTIQPLVENSIVHGLEPKRGGGAVRIGIWEDEDAIYIRITDDGVGFDASQLTLDIHNNAPAAGASHNHIALANIARRIQLLYGSKYGMKIVSSPGNGTTITVTVPAPVSYTHLDVYKRQPRQPDRETPHTACQTVYRRHTTRPKSRARLRFSRCSL